MTTTAQLYRHMIRDSLHPFCWACGAEGEAHDRPTGWYGPWCLERSHIVNKPRIEDIRCVVLLCSVCHLRSRGAKIIFDGGRTFDLPPLRLEHFLFLKRTFDRANYDREFLKRYSVQKLPRAHRPPLGYRTLFLERHAE